MGEVEGEQRAEARTGAVGEGGPPVVGQGRAWICIWPCIWIWILGLPRFTFVFAFAFAFEIINH